jgi:hypothetical protein
MKTPIRYSRGRMTYTGRISRARFDEWAASPDGRPAIERVASGIRFALFGRMRAARRRTWRRLARAARAEEVARAIRPEVDRYLARLATIVYAHNLPRADVHLHRLVVVPRVFVGSESYRRIDAILRTNRAFTSLDGADSLRPWFTAMLLDSMAAAVVAARPSPRRPLPAGNGWDTVGVNELFQWHVPFEGPAFPGHYHVLEQTRMPMTRAVRKAASDAVARLEDSLASLSRSDRYEILQQAGAALDDILSRASRPSPTGQSPR